MTAAQLRCREGDLERARALRIEVFCGEQGVLLEEELDDIDERAHHVGVENTAGEALGTARVYATDEGVVHLGRVCVRHCARGLGVGRVACEAAAQIALREFGHAGQVRIVLDAQEDKIGFYRALGYELTAREPFLDARIWHREMARIVSAG